MALYVPDHNADLSDRERTILRAVVQLFILNASPVGSRILSRHLEHDLKLSPATIRNVMADLEDWGFISHPHTSAGRMPTDKGYRVYVDSLMQLEELSAPESKLVDELALRPRETILRDASRILGSLAKALAVVSVPRFAEIIVRKVELFPLSSERLLVVVALESDLVRTITLETGTLPEGGSLDQVASHINERLSGKPIRRITDVFPELNVAHESREPSLLRLFVEHMERLTLSEETTDIHMAGAQQLLQHPEFGNPEGMRSVIELMDNEDVIVHLVDAVPDSTDVSVRIGNELQNEQFSEYSMIATTYRVGSASGSIALIGPKRMQYSKLMALVHTVGHVLSRSLHNDLP
jgi:heat-inducible transcriptional repressor